MKKCIIHAIKNKLARENEFKISGSTLQDSRRLIAGVYCLLLSRFPSFSSAHANRNFWSRSLGVYRNQGVAKKETSLMPRCTSVAILGVFVTVCGGCGGGGGSPSDNALPEPDTVPIAVTLNMNGDSTMQGWITVNGASIRANPTAPQALEGYLREALGSAVTVINSGKSGQTVCNFMNGTGAYTKYGWQTLQADGAQIEVANWALNDSNPKVSDGETTSEFQYCLESFVDTVRSMGKTPALEEPNPIGSAPLDNVASFSDAALVPYVQIVDYVAQEKHVTLIPQYSYLHALPNIDQLLSDGVHPTQDLYAIKAQREYDVLAPIVKAMQ